MPEEKLFLDSIIIIIKEIKVNLKSSIAFSMID
jgi:hypothetical protein